MARHAHRVPIYSLNGGPRPMLYVSRKEAERLEKEVGPLKKRYIEHPELKPPDGEPFETFEKRWGGALRQFMRHNEAHPDDQVALVIHGNMDMSAPAIVLGEKVTARHYDKMRPPGSISVLRWSKDSEPHIDVINEGVAGDDGSRDTDNSKNR